MVEFEIPPRVLTSIIKHISKYRIKEIELEESGSFVLLSIKVPNEYQVIFSLFSKVSQKRSKESRLMVFDAKQFVDQVNVVRPCNTDRCVFILTEKFLTIESGQNCQVIKPKARRKNAEDMSAEDCTCGHLRHKPLKIVIELLEEIVGYDEYNLRLESDSKGSDFLKIWTNCPGCLLTATV